MMRIDFKEGKGEKNGLLVIKRRKDGGLVLSGRLLGRKNWQRCAVGDARNCQDSGCGDHQEATSILPLKTFPVLK